MKSRVCHNIVVLQSEPVALAYIIHALVTLLLVYGVMLVLGIRIHLHLKRSEQFVTKNTLRIQHCLTFVLTIQVRNGSICGPLRNHVFFIHGF